MDIRKTLFLLAALGAAPALADEIYRWVDEDGVVHYSDQPREGAELVVLEGRRTAPRPSQRPAPASRDTQPAAGARNAEDGGDEPEPQSSAYDSLEVQTPSAEQTLWNIEGVLNVALAVSPELRPGHQVRVYFDGEPRTVSGTRFTIEEVWRGVHNIQAEILDERGQMIIRSRTNRFYVQQSTVNIR